MRIVQVETVISKGAFANSKEWQDIRDQAHTAVRASDWPPGSGKFTIYPESGKKSGQGNGVKPIKENVIRKLTSSDLTHSKLVKSGQSDFDNCWVAEYPWPVGERIKPGNMDAAYITEKGLVCFEWETGNISSSHRSINKICLGLHKGLIRGGMLVVPSRTLYPFLTDRIGNISELEPYLELWQATPCDEGVFEIVVIEHDDTSYDVPRIPKGTDGRAAR